MKLLGALLSSLVVLVGCSVATAATDQVYQESSFTWTPTDQYRAVVADAAATDGSAFRLSQNGSGKLTASTPSVVNIRVRARGEQYVNVWPNMRITLNGTVVANQVVGQGTYLDYNFPVTVPAGSNTFQIALTNGGCDWWGCNRVLFVDNVTVAFEDTSTTTTTTTSETPTTTTEPTTPPPTGVDYVAMGDSYSSGWGANRNVAGVDPSASYEACGRSNKAAQVVLAAERNWNLTNRACGGANTQKNLTTESIDGEGPQMDWVTSTTDVITLTIGGNDTSLIWILDQCVRAASPLCWGGISGASMQNQFNDKLVAFGPKMDAVLRTMVQRAAPGVKIRAAGYPFIVSPVGDPVGTCTWMTASEQAAFLEMHIKTNNAIRDSVQRIATETSADIAYVDPLSATSPFMARDSAGVLGTSCAPQNAPIRYMNNVTEVTLANGGWHPNISGQYHYKELYAAALP